MLAVAPPLRLAFGVSKVENFEAGSSIPLRTALNRSGDRKWPAAFRPPQPNW